MVKQFKLEDEDIALINQFTKRELKQDEVYTFSVILCDNEIDRDFERFDNEALATLSRLYVGKTGVFDHEAKGKNQAARIYHTELLIDKSKQNSLGEPYSFVKAKSYMVKSGGNSELMLEIDGGIKKEVSVSCSVGRTTCSICGAELAKNKCSHKKGKSYDGKICHHVLSDVTDVYEWSFVAVPAQKNAGVTKAFCGSGVNNMDKNIRNLGEICKAFCEGEGDDIVISKAEAILVIDEMERLNELSAVGKAYRDDLVCEVKRMAFLVDGALPTSVVGSVLEKLDIAEIKAFKKSYDEKLCATASVQLKPAEFAPLNNSNQFKI